MERLNLEYYYGKEAEQFTFYRLPKALITDNRFKYISNNAKLLQEYVDNGLMRFVNGKYSLIGSEVHSSKVTSFPFESKRATVIYGDVTFG